MSFAIEAIEKDSTLTGCHVDVKNYSRATAYWIGIQTNNDRTIAPNKSVTLAVLIVSWVMHDALIEDKPGGHRHRALAVHDVVKCPDADDADKERRDHHHKDQLNMRVMYQRTFQPRCQLSKR